MTAFRDVKVEEDIVTVNITANKTDEENQYSEIIGETKEYIVSLIKNTDTEGNLTWVSLFFTKKDEGDV